MEPFPIPPTVEQITAQVNEECEPLLRTLAILLAYKEVANQSGYTLQQQCDFHTPWGKEPESKEEQAHQDLVWIHKVLPPHDTFDPVKAKSGYYTKLRWQRQDEFWSQHDPSLLKTQRYKPTAILTKKSSNLRDLTHRLAEENYVL